MRVNLRERANELLRIVRLIVTADLSSSLVPNYTSNAQTIKVANDLL
jgi:hypothetical protein